MRRFLPAFLLLLLLGGCATTSRVPLREVVGSPTVRTKVVLLDTGKVDPAYQDVAAREFEVVLLTQPITYVLRSAFGERLDLVLITRKEVQRIQSLTPEEVQKLAQRSDIHLLVVVEPVKVDYREQEESRRENEFCVTREAEAVVSVKVAETKGGDVVLAGLYGDSSKETQCSQGIKRTDKLPSKDLLVVRALKKAADKFSKDFWSSL